MNGKKFSIEHAFSCHCGGLPSMQHDDIRGITAEILTEACPSVSIEPTLKPLNKQASKQL